MSSFVFLFSMLMNEKINVTIKDGMIKDGIIEYVQNNCDVWIKASLRNDTPLRIPNTPNAYIKINVIGRTRTILRMLNI